MKDLYKILNYENWHELKKDIIKDLCGVDKFPDNRFIFRGQKDEDWKLIATFDRKYGALPFEKRRKIENSLVNNFTRLCIEWDGRTNFKQYTNLQLMSVGQHYGLPTRLLDWTYSLYIAAFFAYCDIDNYDSNVAIWVIDKEHDIWQGDSGVTIETCRIEENDRQKYQYGVFTLNKSPDKTIEDYAIACSRSYNTEGALFKIILPSEQKSIVLSDLEMMGINYFSLYRGMEGCAKAAVLKDLLEREH